MSDEKPKTTEKPVPKPENNKPNTEEITFLELQKQIDNLQKKFDESIKKYETYENKLKVLSSPTIKSPQKTIPTPHPGKITDDYMKVIKGED